METRTLYPPFTVGVDLGGTNTVYAIVDKTGHIIDQSSFPTMTPTLEEWADRLADGISDMISSCDLEGEIVGIGIGAPSANAATGCVEGSTNLPWTPPLPLVNMIEARLSLPVKINNDANAAAIGEMAYGVAAGMKDFIVLTLGTGVGGGIVCNGHLLSGARGFAGELGHVTFPFAKGRICGCKREGCLETVASARGIVMTAKILLEQSDEPSLLRNIAQNDMTAKDISEAAKAGDKIAASVYEFTGRCLGEAAAQFAAFTDPEAIILFGGVSKAGDLLINPMREAFAMHTLHLYRDRVRFLISSLKDADAAILGAASLPYL